MRSDFPSALGSRVGPADTDFIFETSFGLGRHARGSFGGEDYDAYARALLPSRSRVHRVQDPAAARGTTTPRQTYRTRRRNPSSTSTTARPDDTSLDEKVHERARLGATAAAGQRGRFSAFSAAAGTKLDDFPALHHACFCDVGLFVFRTGLGF